MELSSCLLQASGLKPRLSMWVPAAITGRRQEKETILHTCGTIQYHLDVDEFSNMRLAEVVVTKLSVKPGVLRLYIIQTTMQLDSAYQMPPIFL